MGDDKWRRGVDSMAASHRFARQRAEQRVLEALREWRAWDLHVGTEHVDTIREEDLELEITIRVRRWASGDDVVKYRSGALAVLEQRPFHVRRCGVYVEARGLLGRRSRECRGAVVAAIAYNWRAEGVSYLFVCNRHRETTQIEARAVLAVVELPAARLEEIRALDQKRHAEWLREQELAEACGCRETYPQLVPGKISHGPGCPAAASNKPGAGT